MKRSAELSPLSRDHNHVLVLARRAQRAAKDADAAAVRAAWGALHAAWEDEMAGHFEREERLLLPHLRRHDHAGLADRLQREHDAIRRTLTRADGMDAQRLGVLGEILEHHVRVEEREAFPLLEQRLTPAELSAIEAALAAPANDRNRAANG